MCKFGKGLTQTFVYCGEVTYCSLSSRHTPLDESAIGCWPVQSVFLFLVCCCYWCWCFVCLTLVVSVQSLLIFTTNKLSNKKLSKLINIHYAILQYVIVCLNHFYCAVVYSCAIIAGFLFQFNTVYCTIELSHGVRFYRGNIFTLLMIYTIPCMTHT